MIKYIEDNTDIVYSKYDFLVVVGHEFHISHARFEVDALVGLVHRKEHFGGFKNCLAEDGLRHAKIGKRAQGKEIALRTVSPLPQNFGRYVAGGAEQTDAPDAFVGLLRVEEDACVQVNKLG